MSACTLSKGSTRAGITLKIRPHPTANLIDIGLKEKGTVQVIYMLGKQGSTHAALSNVKQYFQNLLLVHSSYRNFPRDDLYS